MVFLRIIIIAQVLALAGRLSAQTPAPLPLRDIVLTGATLHLGNGKVMNKADILIHNGKIEQLGKVTIPAQSEIIAVEGKHIYPGFITLNSDLGLEEVESVRATLDAREVGAQNSNARAIIAYNTDSKVTPTVRSNGILMAQIAPKGGMFAGTSAVVQLDAWNYEDATIVAEEGIYLNLPEMRPNFSDKETPLEDQRKLISDKIESIYQTLRKAQAYAKIEKPIQHDLALEALKPIIRKEKKLYIRANSESQITAAIGIAQQFNLNIVIVGGQESYLLTEILKKYKIPVILSKPHSLPLQEDDAVDLPYRLPYILETAGIPYGYDMDVFWNERNLPFQAGTAVAYGLDKEMALKALTLYPASILGIEQQAGTLEIGKDATLIISEGDVLDMRTSQIIHAFIQGRKISLQDLHKELYEKFKAK